MADDKTERKLTKEELQERAKRFAVTEVKQEKDGTYKVF